MFIGIIRGGFVVALMDIGHFFQIVQKNTVFALISKPFNKDQHIK